MNIGIFYKGDDGKFHLDYDTFLDRFLKASEVVRYEKMYYHYDSEQGIWRQRDLEDIQLEAARFLESETGESWNVAYKKQTLEKLKVATQEVREMNQSDVKVCLRDGVLNVEQGKR